MGLLFEYSRLDDFAYQNVPPRDPIPITPERTEPESTDTDRKAAAQRHRVTSWTGGNIAVAGVLMIVAFVGFALVMGIVTAFVLIGQNPEVLDVTQTTDPYAAAQELIAPMEEALVLQYLLVTIIYALSLLVGVLFIGSRVGWQWFRLGFIRLTTSRITYAITIGVFGSLIMIGMSLFVNTTGEESEALVQLDTLLQQSNQTVLLGAVLAAIILIPFAEEAFFRGVIYNWLRERNGVIYGAVLSAIAYALFNFNPLGFFPTLAIGAAMALVYERTGSVWGVYLSHSAFNCVTILLYLYALNSLG